MIIAKTLRSEISFSEKTQQVNKLYYAYIDQSKVNNEFQATSIAFSAGLPCLQPIKMFRKQARHGITFPYIEGESLTTTIRLKPWRIAYYGRQIAELHYKIHQKKPGLLQTQTSILLDTLSLVPPEINSYLPSLMKIIESLKGQSLHLCHADFTPDNIMIDKDGNWIVIDWADAHLGNPLYDVARTVLLINSPSAYKAMNPFLAVVAKKAAHYLSECYLKHYLKLSGINYEQYENMRYLAAAARMNELIPHEKESLFTILKGLQ